METEVLIVGAGPTGLVLAIDLARRGIRHRIVDQSERGFPGSRGTGIQPRTLEVLDDLGAVEALMACGGPVPLVQNWRGTERTDVRQLVVPADASPGVPYPVPWMVPQWRTVEVLTAHLEELGGHVEFRTELTGFAHDADGVTATLRRADGTAETVRAAWLVAADGGRSTVRRTLGVPMTGTQVVDPHPMLVADVILEGPDRPHIDRDHWHMWAENGLLALRPFEGTETTQVMASFPDAEGALEAAQALTPDDIGRLVAERSGLRLTVGEVRWSSAFRPRMGMAERFRTGRVLLAGDAAHIHSPAGGQGLNTSLQDAYNLGWKLAAVLRLGAPDSLIDTYDAERSKVAADVLSLSSRIHASDRVPERGPQRRGKETHQLTLGYRESPLSRELRREIPEGGLQAGDRAPDAPCGTPAGGRRCGCSTPSGGRTSRC
ncbi:FAD-dependent oxidoreductase [Streptomyces olivoverticillatus]